MERVLEELKTYGQMLKKERVHKKNKNILQNLTLVILSISFFFLIMESILYLPLFSSYFERDIKDLYYMKDDKMVFFRTQKSIDFNNITNAYLLSLMYTCGDTNYGDCNIRICEDERVKEKNNAFRIVFLGDSVTHGMYFGEVTNSKKIFTSIINEKLKNISSKKFEVFNFGFSGYNLEDMIHLNNFASKCNPDLVVYDYVQDDRFSPTDTTNRLPYLKFKYSDKWYHKSRASLVIVEKSKFIFFRFRVLYIDKISFKLLDDKIAEDNLDLILSKNSNAKFYIINFPFNKKNFPSDNFIEGYSKKKGIDYLDIRKKLLENGLDPLTLRASKDDIAHYNYRGHEILADFIYEDFINKGLIKS